jgi:hypothetical protein
MIDYGFLSYQVVLVHQSLDIYCRIFDIREICPGECLARGEYEDEAIRLTDPNRA